MPLHGKIVVIKRSGGDGTEFPLISTCLIGRRPDCDIRIQLPQVSKEHCRIDLNENKEVILTNLSSVNPTCVNGEALQQSERLKHGDVITVIDRSFRFEYPPPPTPKKRSSKGGKTETLKILQDQQVGATVATETGEKRISEVTTDPHLKDGTNHDNIQRPLEKTVEVETKEDDSLLQSKTASPFNDLYQMIKKSLDVKTPRKSSASVLQTPTSRFCTPKPGSVRKNDGKPVLSTADKSTPKKDEAKVSPVADETKGEAENVSNGTPKSVKKQRRSSQVPSTELAGPEVGEAENAASSEATSPQKRSRTPPQRFSACEVEPKSPVRRRSKEAEPAVTEEQEEQAVTPTKTDGLRRSSPRNSGKEASKKRKYGEVEADSPTPQMKRKRVSFGGYLCPELFDKRLPPDSPLCKGATPRRSLCVSKPKQSLLRRASAIGLRQEFEEEHPRSPNVRSPAKMRTPSPKSSKKSPKARTPSPKAASPAKKSPKSKSPSPARRRSPTVGVTPGVQTPLIQGRFSVSHISTPSPVAEAAVTDQVPLVTVTPKVPLRRKSLSRETPSMAKSAVKVMRRRSGISRASLKVKNSWADIVRFGPTKPQVAVPAKKIVTKKAAKKTVSKPQTPARKLKDHVSTGHADSPVTIVVGRAHKQKVLHPTGAAPRLVTNIALLKKNMKMDEDLSGISEMLKTPLNERKGRSVIGENDATKTPVGGLATSVVEPSVLNTPEETGEMMVSPLSVSSTVKDRRYNTEAVQRLLNDDQESSIVSDSSASEIHCDDFSEQCTDLKTTSVTTPKQKPELPECLTGVKRIMKTPRQKAEPVEDIRGKLLKTPKQKPEQQECLTGVKRIMKTPRQKAEPVEDIRGKILKTPKQKPEQQECLTGVKRMMTTPRQEAKPVEDIREELLTTPKQKPEQQQCLSGVKRICKTPQQEAEPLEDVQGKLLQAPKALEAGDASLGGVEQTVETPAHMQESEDLSEMTDMKTPNVKSSPLVPPREKAKPDEENFGIKRLVKTPRQSSSAPEEDFGGLQELMEEPLAEPTGQLETNEVEDQTAPDCDEDVAKEEDANEVVVVDDHVEEVPSGHNDNESSGAVETISQAAVDENISVEQPTVDAADENISEEQPTVDAADENISEEQPTVDAADENISEEKPTVDTADENISEQPTVDAADEILPVEQPTVDEKISEEQPTVDAIDENISGEQPTVDAADEILPVEQPTVDENISGEQPTVDAVDENISVEQPTVETATGKVTEMDTTVTEAEHEKKSVRGRRAKTAEDIQEAAEQSEDPVVPAPVRGRRGKKTEAAAPPAVKQTARGRNAKSQEDRDVELTMEKSASLPPKVALKPRRGRNAKTASDDQPEMVQEVAPEIEQNPPVDVDQEAHDSAAPLEKAVLKPKRGRKTKQPEQPVPEQEDVPSTHSDGVPQADMANADSNEVCSDQVEMVLSGSDENQEQATVETATGKVTKLDTTVTEAEHEKKSVRGRRAKTAEDKQEAAEQSEDPVVPAPVRGRRGKKTEAAAPPAVKQTARGRNAKSQEDRDVELTMEKSASLPPKVALKPRRGRNAKTASDDQPEMGPEKAVETPVAEISTEAVSDQTPMKENESAPPAEEAVLKPVRGRKTKPTPVEPPQPEKNEVVINEPLTADAQPQKSIPTLGKARRGRQTKPDAVERNEVMEDTVVAVETKQQSQPPVRAKRGRNAKQEEEKLESTSVETAASQEPAKKLRRTRKAEQDVEPREVQAVEMVIPEKTEAPLVAEPVTMDEQTAVAAKPRRGGRKAKQDPEVQEVPAVSATDKLKRGRRGKLVTEEVGVPAVVPEEQPDHELEAEEKNIAEPDAPVIKPSRARGVKTSVKNEVSQAIPAKRARRGAALPLDESSAESTAPAPTSVEPAKRGRRAAAAKPTADDATVTGEQPNPTEDSSDAVVEDAKMSKRSVRWKSDLEVFDVSRVTPVKAVRGRKPKLAVQVDAESKTVSKDAEEAEEKDLSDRVVEAQPVKRARRGAKVADVTTAEAESTRKVESVEAETQPKTRRGRIAKK
ncbi:proliferation marker protein Ki-67 isoform X3 [Perca flavescens]|uniref:proliferation marker protein Ki-67 isoform X3 n=1 Tax=Perca flavescens TaxID=8167 RepID=UPI00106EB3BD|nr:proliferation marker protein Ki-67 isoform X3 [Perca flavescens]